LAACWTKSANFCHVDGIMRGAAGLRAFTAAYVRSSSADSHAPPSGTNSDPSALPSRATMAAWNCCTTWRMAATSASALVVAAWTGATRQAARMSERTVRMADSEMMETPR